MPGVTIGSRSSSEGPSGDKPTSNPSGSSESSLMDEDYAAASFPGYSEKPLEEQLEPIAVIGMGK